MPYALCSEDHDGAVLLLTNFSEKPLKVEISKAGAEELTEQLAGSE